MAIEVPKRLEPTKTTVRQLFAHSGNRCAFEGCEHELIDAAENFVAEICHIRAALPAGARFDPSMTNDERRAPANLMLMCHRHHVVTDNLKLYPTERLQQIKAAHEAAFAAKPLPISETQIDQAVQYFVDSDIADRTLESPYGVPVTCALLNQINGWDVSPEQAAGWATQCAEYVQVLRRVPVDARAVLSIAVERGENMGSSFECLLADVALATRQSEDDIRTFCSVLAWWDIGGARYDEMDGKERVVVGTFGDMGNVWEDIKHFVQRTGMTVRDFAVGLRFDALDDGP
jgi:hypothetical protein